MAVNQPTAYIPCILLWNLLTSFLVRMCVRLRAVCSIDIFENGTFEHFTPAVPDNFETIFDAVSLCACLDPISRARPKKNLHGLLQIKD